MGRNRSLLFLILAVLAVFVALPRAQSSTRSSHLQIRAWRGGQGRPWPCCDSCGGCTKSAPARCRCLDVVRGCHPACNDCVKSSLSVDPPMYQCMDRVPNFCDRRCTTASH